MNNFIKFLFRAVQLQKSRSFQMRDYILRSRKHSVFLNVLNALVCNFLSKGSERQCPNHCDGVVANFRFLYFLTVDKKNDLTNIELFLCTNHIYLGKTKPRCLHIPEASAIFLLAPTPCGSFQSLFRNYTPSTMWHMTLATSSKVYFTSRTPFAYHALLESGMRINSHMNGRKKLSI